MRGQSYQKQRTQGLQSFTLIEPLVVVAIIGILASMLLPVLVMSRNKAKAAICVGTQRQVGTAIFRYPHDYDEYPLPRRQRETGSEAGERFPLKKPLRHRKNPPA